MCRQDEPEIEIRLSHVPLSQQLKGLHDDLYDVGFAQSDQVGDGIIAVPAWSEPLLVAVPARHPLLTHKHIPLDEVLRYPLVLGDSEICEGYARQVDRILRQVDLEPLVAERTVSTELMLTLVSAGFALGLAGASQIAASPDTGVVARPLAGRSPMLMTYLLRRDGEPSEVLARFIERVHIIEKSDSRAPSSPPSSDTSEEIEP